MYAGATRIACICLFPCLAAAVAETQPPENDYVSREEYEALRRDFEELKAKMETGKNDWAAPPPGAEPVEQPSPLELERARLRMEAYEQSMEDTKHWYSNFLISGYGFTRFQNIDGENSTFTAQFVPLFLWQITDRLLFEAEVEFELEAEDGVGKTAVNLEYADASYILNDYITLGAGKFLTPFGLFAERLHPAWINKLPDSPLIYGHDGIAPFTSLGIFVRGGFPVGSTKFNYAIYLSNGPALNTGSTDPDQAGTLGFDNFADINNGKSVGGRVGFLPIPEVEVGFSWQWGQVNPNASMIVVGDADAFLWGFDVTYVQDSDFLAGLFDIRFEYAHSDVEDVTYLLPPPDGPLTFDNVRNGLYAQVAYRPTKCSVKFLRDFEIVGRYDYLNLPSGAPESNDEQRWTIGLNYWFNPSTVLKFAYEYLDIQNEPNKNAFLAMFAVGF